MLVTKICKHNKKTYTMEIPAVEKQLSLWLGCPPAARVSPSVMFPHLKFEELEFLTSGTPPEVMKELKIPPHIRDEREET